MLIQSALLALAASLAAAVPSLEVRGNHFVNPSTGNRFQILGIDYQPGGSAGYLPDQGKDPLTDPEVCKRDAALMQRIGFNAIRVYNLSPNLNHDACASIFNAAGMYMVIDVNSPLVGDSLTSFEPWTSYYDTYLNRTFAIVEAFKDYPNTLLFFSGNEVIDNVENAQFGPRYIRAVTRDIKNYIKKHSKRPIPVGYSAADVRSILQDSFNYFTCSIDGEKDNESRADVFALNSYSWCGNSNFDDSTYDDLVAALKNCPVPVFFSEFGCNKVEPRPFSEIATIYGPEMTGVFSGGMVYEWTFERNAYGIVNISADGTLQLLQDYSNLAEQYKKLDTNKLQGQKSSGNYPAPIKCSPGLIKETGFDNNFTIPVMPFDNSAKILDAGVSPKPVGKIINISDFKVTLPVKGVDGKAITNLAVNALAQDQTNTPGGTNPDGSKAGDEDAGAYLKPTLLGLALPLLAIFFA